jgi:hypothetical protein
MQFLAIFFTYAACIVLLIVVHECGHYVAGWLGGIPLSEMRIRLLTFPQHVALWFEDRWVGPHELEPYLATMFRHLTSTPRLFLYTAGGFLSETLFTVAATLLFVQFGLPKMALLVAAMSLVMNLIAVLVLDLPLAWRIGHPAGDVSGLWALAKLPTALVVVGMLAIRVALLWYAAA